MSLLTLHEAAAELRVSVRTLEREIRAALAAKTKNAPTSRSRSGRS